ncbi:MULTISPECIES: ferric citrate uptake sigma factor regulator FecR [unclassified Tatumella]|uniref:ferric citrate uptake sigma factor regulator FecR n=1 Tax=unclassified Tatumella TaxID=2649542 RepID=UPI001BAE6F3D|nr:MULTISPECIES: ferric citrate uptake sigma factor regulator FecR [unclassified Tatumella]MBS0876548.1 fec operon regulator FecR [Tatumella sp. JGM82]MBS0890065.1 fec operon regulator FecR [Tatumella sp. JGM94]MBS0901309.1 fec operon regulator FecR [Tatumella sp. JGM100]
MQTSLSDARKTALRSASYWYAQLNDPQVTAQQTAKWQQWYSGHADNQWAWQQVESLRQQLNIIPAHTAGCLLQDPPATRRSVLKGIVMLAGAATAGWPLWHSELAEAMRADYHTAKGQMLQQSLTDGTLFALNSDSAANVRFDRQQRLVELLYGDIAISTGKDPAGRPFRVLTRPALLTALGTRFSVQQRDNGVVLSVSEHAVEAVLQKDPRQRQRVQQGESLLIQRDGFSALRPADPHDNDWVKGMISFSDQPLSRVITALSGYHSGLLHCTASAADLRLSGTFPAFNTDAALKAIASALPVKIQYITKYIIVISAIN